MKKIGFVDYFIHEWHANNYPAWIARLSEELGLDYQVAYAWAELDASPEDGVTTDAWCADHGVEKCNTLEELCEKSDVIVILCPKNPETHLRYAQKVLPYQKRTYIDKTFAPDAKTARQIFDLAKKYNTPFFTSSALRYATELDAVDAPDSMIVLGSGSNLPEYFIHLGEMVVKKMGAPQSVVAEKNGSQWLMRAAYADGREATMLYGSMIPYHVYMTKGSEEVWQSIASPFFDGLICDMLRFFEDGSTSFDSAQTMEVMHLRDAVLAALETPGSVVML